MIIVLLLCLCFATKNYEVDGWMPSLSKNDDLDLEKQLKVINKPPVKTIQTEFGSIIDCIDINKQLAFDNPLLKNHKIQRKPSFEDTRTKVKAHDRSDRYSMIGLGKNLCPKGTVLVQRTTKEDLMRLNNISILTQDRPRSHFAEVHLNYDAVYYGIQGNISIYNPHVVNRQMSTAYIWLSNGTSDADVISIQAGWQVYPDIYGDTKTHLFASWSNRIQHTGCTNMQCAGFVQTSQRYYLGSYVIPISTYNGTQYVIRFNISQDPITKNWWLKAQDIYVGYFPVELFSNKMRYANHGGWTGRTFTTNSGPSPPMGSGHFPDGNVKHACSISQIKFKDRYKKDIAPGTNMIDTFADNPRCYDVKYYGYKDAVLQHVLMFGGPGGECGN